MVYITLSKIRFAAKLQLFKNYQESFEKVF